MKRYKFNLLTAIVFSIIFQGQVFSQNADEIFLTYANNIVWLGVDFTQVKLTGDMGTVSAEELIPLFGNINLLIITEQDKYDWKEALRKTEVPYDLEMVNKINATIDPRSLISLTSSSPSNQINEEKIAKLVSQYKVENYNGIGLVVFMESLDKVTETGTMWVTFFSLSDHKVLLTERMSGEATGFGFRNHWAATVYYAIKHIKSTRYYKWKSIYSK